jgi:hypothetical protein
MTRQLALLLLLATAACAGGQPPPLAEPSGPLRPLNAGRWTPTAADLRGEHPPVPQPGAGG